MKITIDTNVLVRAHGKAFGTAQQLLEVIVRKRHELILSSSILYELEEVLHYPKIRKMTCMTDPEITTFVQWLTRASKLVDLGTPTPFPIRDYDDWMVLRKAIMGEADVLCTCDRHLHHRGLEPIYRRAGIEVLTDVELLKRL